MARTHCAPGVIRHPLASVAGCVRAGGSDDRHPTQTATPFLFISSSTRHSTVSRAYTPHFCQPTPTASTPPTMSVAKAVIWKPSEHADEYIVFVDDVKEVSAHLRSPTPLCAVLWVSTFIADHMC